MHWRQVAREPKCSLFKINRINVAWNKTIDMDFATVEHRNQDTWQKWGLKYTRLKTRHTCEQCTYDYPIRHMARSHDKQGITWQTWNKTWRKWKHDRDKTKSWKTICKFFRLLGKGQHLSEMKSFCCIQYYHFKSLRTIRIFGNTLQ